MHLSSTPADSVNRLGGGWNIGKWVSETSAAVGRISVNSKVRRSDLSSMTGATLGE